VRCTGFSTDASGRVDEVHCDYLPDTKSGTPGADAVKVKGNIHWVSAAHACEAEVRLYDRLFRVPNPGKATGNYLDDVNPDSMRAIRAYLEPSLAQSSADERFQFERHGYFCPDRRHSKPGAPVFNRTVTLRDSWSAK
jgi:glutaminyl-tRNA synthetase